MEPAAFGAHRLNRAPHIIAPSNDVGKTRLETYRLKRRHSITRLSPRTRNGHKHDTIYL